MPPPHSMGQQGSLVCPPGSRNKGPSTRRPGLRTPLPAGPLDRSQARQLASRRGLVGQVGIPAVPLPFICTRRTQAVRLRPRARGCLFFVWGNIRLCSRGQWLGPSPGSLAASTQRPCASAGSVSHRARLLLLAEPSKGARARGWVQRRLWPRGWEFGDWQGRPGEPGSPASASALSTQPPSQGEHSGCEDSQGEWGSSCDAVKSGKTGCQPAVQ